MAHQHAAELIPIDLSAIDDQPWEAVVVGIVPLDPTAHDPIVRNLQPVVAVLEMFD